MFTQLIGCFIQQCLYESHDPLMQRCSGGRHITSRAGIFRRRLQGVVAQWTNVQGIMLTANWTD